jgi:hypothetical protein
MKLDWVTDQLEIHGTALRASSRALEQLLTRMEALAAAQAGGAGDAHTPGANSEGSTGSAAGATAAAARGGADRFQRAGTLARMARAMVPGGHR